MPSIFSLNTKTAIVTEADSGIRQTFTIFFARQDTVTWAVNRDATAADATVKALREVRGLSNDTERDVNDFGAVHAAAYQITSINALARIHIQGLRITFCH